MRKRLWFGLLALVVLALGAWLAVRAILGSDLVRSALEQQLASRLGQPVRVGEASAAVFPRIAVDLHEVAIGEPAAVELDAIRVVTGLRGLISRRIEDAEIVVRRGRIALPVPFPLVPAAPAGQPAADSGDAAFTIASIRVISLREITFAGGGEELRVDLDSSVDGDRLDVSRLVARGRTTNLDASGGLTSIARLEGRFEGRADPLDLTELIAFGSAMSAPSGPASAKAPPMDIRVTLVAPDGRFDAYAFSNLSVEAQLRPGRVVLAPLSLGMFGGEARGKLDIDTSGSAPRLRLDGRLENVDVDALMQEGSAPGGLTGRLGGAVSLTAAGTGAEALMKGARGTIDAAITDGSVPGMDMVRTIVLAFGKPSGAPPEGSGSAFSRLGGRFTLANGTLASDDVTMASRDFDLAGSVRFNLLTGALDARADVRLSKELTAQAGTDLRRYAGEDGRVIVPATIGGTLDKPVVLLDIAAVTKRAIEGELRRRTKSFIEDLFRRKR